MFEVQLKAIEMEKRNSFLDYLLLADESEEIVREYINDGEMFAMLFNGQIIGVAQFIFLQDGIVELKNIAIIEDYRGKGIGKLVIKEAFGLYKMKGLNKMLVGTANSSIANLAFYQKLGFRMDEIKKDFFKKYPTPIYENGIRALDMVMLERDL
ncbi:GNAT family N-acetyltransferase [Neobacillus vireti]|uniref:Acetyltransferase n=1 Tax=Neobacillus vireti LMG 21834 TaxID=1131730 RepID=A0AB94ITK0_9BACI|nr:GNAT family N-acetyltransferase [Neobacillus vireti]ETI70400.1 acetyltransferase [Neobacillus vireti LMG 21834]KLT17794.1 acyltransferase [Neobacillus vireti]